jgi:hypothetical protein
VNVEVDEIGIHLRGFILRVGDGGGPCESLERRRRGDVPLASVAGRASADAAGHRRFGVPRARPGSRAAVAAATARRRSAAGR